MSMKIPISRPYFGDEERAAIVEPLETGWVVQGPKVAEFERLLDEVARDGRGPQELRSHLTSETGLVYTLLAHSAGRLG